METKNVFISYSHTSEKHKEDVRLFASSLSAQGIYVHLDEWDVTGGNDFPTYMEQCISKDDKVLIITDKRYAEKADGREGGIGIETYIISPEVYAKHDQNKFIAIVFEKDELGKPYLPAYIKTRKYYDLSSQEQYPYEFDLILRDIFNKPKFSRPPLGEVPIFIQDYEASDPKSKFNGFYSLERYALSLNKTTQSSSCLNQFTDLISNAFSDNLISYEALQRNPAEIVYSKIQEFEDLLRVFISTLEADIGTNKNYVNDLVRLFETMSSFEGVIPEGSGTSTDGMWDHFLFLLHEFFIYSILILRRQSKFQEVATLLKTNYYCNRKHEKPTFVQFDHFNRYYRTFEIRASKYQLRRLSLQADTMYERAGKTKFGASSVVETDLLLGYYSEILFVGVDRKWWFPRMYFYRIGSSPLFGRMESKRHLRNLLIELGINSKDDLVKIITQVDSTTSENTSGRRGYNGAFDYVPTLKQVLNPDQIGKIE